MRAYARNRASRRVSLANANANAHPKPLDAPRCILISVSLCENVQCIFSQYDKVYSYGRTIGVSGDAMRILRSDNFHRGITEREIGRYNKFRLAGASPFPLGNNPFFEKLQRDAALHIIVGLLCRNDLAHLASPCSCTFDDRKQRHKVYCGTRGYIYRARNGSPIIFLNLDESRADCELRSSVAIADLSRARVHTLNNSIFIPFTHIYIYICIFLCVSSSSDEKIDSKLVDR